MRQLTSAGGDKRFASSLGQIRSVVTSCRAVLLPRFGGPEVLEIRDDVPVPDLKDNEVLVRARAVSVNPLDTRASALLFISATCIARFCFLFCMVVWEMERDSVVYVVFGGMKALMLING